MKSTKGTSNFLQLLVYEKNVITGQQKWITAVGISPQYWLKSFHILKITTADTKLQWFQIRILHNILTTNRTVSKFMTNQTDLCEFCGSHSETIQHLMWYCSKVQHFWIELFNILKNRSSQHTSLVLSQSLVLFGLCPLNSIDRTCHLIILMAKFYIYRSKVHKTNLNLRHFIKEVYNRYTIEMYIHNNSEDFKNAWASYLNLFKSLL